MSNPATALGIDIGGTNLRVARVSGIGEILDWSAEPIARDPSGPARPDRGALPEN